MDIARFLLPDPRLLLIDAVEIDEMSPLITLVATVTQASACCPLCEQRTTRVHSRYRRTVADLPWTDVPVRLRLAVRRFRCDNPACSRAIFCECIPSVVLAWARRTQRLARAQTAIGVAAGGAGGSRLCAALSMQAGIDLLLALIRRLPLPERATPIVLGVNDWAQITDIESGACSGLCVGAEVAECCTICVTMSQNVVKWSCLSRVSFLSRLEWFCSTHSTLGEETWQG